MATYKRVPVESLYVDDRYQRPVEDGRVKRMASKFDEALLGALEVSQRNGTGSYAVFDGQHRLEAAKLAGIKTLPCLVHKGLAPEEEASLFVSFQRQRKTISSLDRFKARLFMGDETAEQVLAIVESCSYAVGSSHNRGAANTISSVVTLERVLERGNLAQTLTLLGALWWGDDKSTDGQLIDGLSLFEQGYAHRLSDEKMAKLREVGPTVILRRARGPMGGGGSGMGLVVMREIRKAAGMTRRPSGGAKAVEEAA